MARKPTIRDEDILAAAREVFLARGQLGTSAEVAAKAGISEGTIFKRFKTKAKLFEAAMRAPGQPPAFVVLLSDRLATQDVRETLYEAGLLALDFYQKLMPLTMMAWANPAARASFSGGMRGIEALAELFRIEMERGRIRQVPAEALARAYLGSLANHAAMELVFKQQDQTRPQDFVRDLVEVLWTGISPVAERA